MTKTQQKYYDWIIAFMAKERRAPLYQEIGDAMGVPKSNAYVMVNNLIEKGLFKRVGKRGTPGMLVSTGACPCCGRSG